MAGSQGLYHEFILPEWFHGPEPLRDALYQAWSGRYADLYDVGGQHDVETTFEMVLPQLGDLGELIPQKRHVFMALAMALAAQPTIRGYNGADERPQMVIAAVSKWLEETSRSGHELSSSMFAEAREFGGHAAVDEAYAIFSELVRSLDPRQTDHSVRDILYAAITGDAISGFAAAKRDIFNWWLIEVTPAAYHLRLPSVIYPSSITFKPLSAG